MDRWRRFFQDPSSWWDNRGKNWGAKYPQFKHVTTGEGLWIASCPQPLRHKLGLLADSISNVKPCRAVYRSPDGETVKSTTEYDPPAATASSCQGSSDIVFLPSGKYSSVNATPTVSSLLAGLKASTATKDLASGKKLHAEALGSGYNTNVYVAAALVSMYFRCGRVEAALEAFNAASSRDVGLWNALLLGLARNGEEQKALVMFSRSQAVCQPNARTMMAVFMACSKLAAKEEGQLAEGKLVKVESLKKAVELHSLADKQVEHPDTYMQSSLIELYAKCGSMTNARLVFDRMSTSDRSVVVWNTLIWGYLENGEYQLVLDLHANMPLSSCAPDSRTLLAAIKACAGLAVKEQPVLASNGRLVKISGLQKGSAIHSQAAKVACIASDVYLSTSLINMYAKCGSMLEARKVFDSMKQLDVAAWNALLLGYVENEDSEQALRLFAKLNSNGDGITADATSYTAALMACGRLIALELGTEIHAEIEKKKLGKHAWLATTLVDFYGKCGVMTAAEQVFESLNVGRCGVAGWNALAAGYSQQGDTTCLLQVVQRMQDKGLKPNAITYLLLLKACSNAGLVEEGKRQFDEMLQNKAAIPTLHHYTCVVDLLGRAGCFDEIESLMNTMPFKPDVVMWMTILGACRKWNNVALGRLAFESLGRLDAKQATSYVLMGEIYGSLGMWEHQKNVLERKKIAGAHKQWGKSWWTDQRGRTHNFAVGDTTHAQNAEIYAKVEELMVKLGEQGYVASAEAETLCGHSEKLALAYALLSTSSDQTIRITKNLRVCDDCHRVTAMISKLERRQIICRDGSRLHLFQDGECSCKGYW